MRPFRDIPLALKRLAARATWRPWTPAQTWHPPCLWSKGISQHCDFKGSGTYWSDDTESLQPPTFFRTNYADAHGLVWLRLGTRSRHGLKCDLDGFVEEALPSIRQPFILITTDGDASVPSDFPTTTVNALLQCPWLVSWYTQNYEGGGHAKLAPLPIGLDLHTPRFCTGPEQLFSQLQTIRSARRPLDQLPLRVFCDLETALVSQARRQAVAALRNCDHVDFQSKRVSQYEIWRRYASYPFVVSAAGNGLDCHRTWELLYLGSIVITKKSPLDPLFEGFPVVTVDDWNEVADKSNLAQWRQQYGGLTAREAIWSRLEAHRVLEPLRQSLAQAPHVTVASRVATRGSQNVNVPSQRS